MGLACIWLAIAAEKTYPVFVLARAFLGIWEAPIEAIVPSTVADIFYLHERGEKVSLYGLSVLGGNELGPLFSAYIIQALSMRWAFFIVAMSIGVNMISMIFFMPETKFNGPRPVIMPRGNVPDKPVACSEGHPKTSSGHCKTVETKTPDKSEREEESRSPKTKMYFQELAFCSAVDPQISLWKILVRPFVLMAYPTVLWASLVYGMSLSWNIILGASVAQLFGLEYVVVFFFPFWTFQFLFNESGVEPWI